METIKDLSIFLVDDDTLFLKSLEYQLQHRLKYNIKIKSFQTGEECLHNLHQKPNIVVLDYLLNSHDPDAMNGLQVLQKIKREAPETEVIMLSGHEKVDVAFETMKSGGFSYVIKNNTTPIEIHEIIKNAIHSIKTTRRHTAAILIAKLFIACFALILLILFIKRVF